MKFWPLQLALQEAPVDGFEPDGPAKFRVVAYDGEPGGVPATDGECVALTDAWDTPSGALGQLRRSIAESMTRYEGGLLDDAVRHVERNVDVALDRTASIHHKLASCKGFSYDGMRWPDRVSRGHGSEPMTGTAAYIGVPDVRVTDPLTEETIDDIAPWVGA